MGGFKLKITGLDEIIAKLDVEKFEQDIQAALDDFGLRIVQRAQLLAPVDEGYLKRAINFQSSKLSVTVSVNTDYAAYIEFGTRKFAAAYVATLPPDWQVFAEQFRGAQPGSFAEMVKRIMAWIKRKGIPEAAAYPIVRKILLNGIKPHPYLYPAVVQETPLLLEDLQHLLT